jgi:hypothetical protein
MAIQQLMAIFEARVGDSTRMFLGGNSHAFADDNNSCIANREALTISL